jgi:hypothetical protein
MNTLHSAVEASIVFQNGQRRSVLIPGDITLSDLRSQVCTSIPDSYIEVLPENTKSDLCLLSSIISSRGPIELKVSLPDEPSPSRLAEVINVIRHVKLNHFADVQERPSGKESRRKATSSVTGALARARILPASLSANAKTIGPIPENLQFVDEHHDYPENDLKRICYHVVDVINTEMEVDTDAALELVRDFRSYLETYLQHLLTTGGFHVPTSLTNTTSPWDEVKSQNRIDGIMFFETLKLIVMDSSVIDGLRSDYDHKLADCFTRPDNREELFAILENFIDSIKSICLLDSPELGALLPDPASKARLSPDMVRWAEGLRPRDKGRY